MNNSQSNQEAKVFFLATDAEWQSFTNEPISVQVSLENGNRYLFLNSTLKLTHELPLQAIESTCESLGINLVLADLTSGDFDCLKYILETEILPKKLNLLMFYSPKDLFLLHGSNNFNRLVLPEQFLDDQKGDEYLIGEISQKRNIKAIYKLKGHTIKVKDLKGWTTGSLKALASSVAIELADKGKMDAYKTNMVAGLINEPESFIEYSIGDTDCLLSIYQKFSANIQSLQSQALELPESTCFTLQNIPMTTGSLVANSFRKYLEHSIGNPDVAAVVFRKLGELNLSQDTSQLKKAQANRETFLGMANSLESLKYILNNCKDSPEISKILKGFLNAEYDTLAYSLASPQVLGKDTKTTTAYLAPVHGGRALNEIPNEYRLTNVLDADLTSAYATAMNNLIYPIGRPRIESFTANQQRTTLKEVLKQIEGKATPGCWVIVVSGKLPFSQDLIMSKVVTAKEINKAMIGGNDDNDNDDNDLSKIPGSIVHLRREIVNGIITEDILKVIKAVASNTEYKAFLSLEVVSMAYHLEADRYDDFEAWTDAILKDQGSVKAVKGNVVDTRTYAWFALPLSKVFGKLTDERKAIKKQAKGLKPLVDAGDLEAKVSYDKLHSDQEARKLFINTGYGTLASVYFATANSIVGNNITAKVRVNAWMMSKALRCPQVITDGGLFSPEKVRFFKEGIQIKLPSLNTLAHPELLDKHRSIALKSMANKNWSELFQRAIDSPTETINIFQEAKAEELTNDHINKFWSAWGLELTFGIELKIGHESVAASYMGKADYCLKKPDGSYEFKIRGAKEFTEHELKSHPKFEILRRVADGLDDISDIILEYNNTYLLKIGRYQEANKSTGWQHIKGLLPGEQVVELRSYKMNNSFVHIDMLEEYKKIERRGRTTNKEGLFERYFNEGWAATLRHALAGKLNNKAR
ncbi:hypothetical protein [Gloeothece verrucosa]|uniref:Uncharacterized protein n=1 Tax=Gloeothece verrucosa (strain PCC 7822) TaxID=497965 RepID=E0UKH0_GLOV7|nr:hypothetical protein [Gloeothece verrucosa]ADN17051.1 hypothetical protein Cyan7822_5168 [Gloeothece verrucosa PCC 7822]